MRGMGSRQNSNCPLIALEIEERALYEVIWTGGEVGKSEKADSSLKLLKTCRYLNFDEQDLFHSSESQKERK